MIAGEGGGGGDAREVMVAESGRTHRGVVLRLSMK
jgi:hypothetical protein